MKRTSPNPQDLDSPSNGGVVGGISGVVLGLFATQIEDARLRDLVTVAAPVLAVWLGIIGAGAEFVCRTAVRNWQHSWTSKGLEKNARRILDDPNSTDVVKDASREALSKVQLMSLAHYERNVNQASKLSLPTPARKTVKKPSQKLDDADAEN